MKYYHALVIVIMLALSGFLYSSCAQTSTYEATWDYNDDAVIAQRFIVWQGTNIEDCPFADSSVYNADILNFPGISFEEFGPNIKVAIKEVDNDGRYISFAVVLFAYDEISSDYLPGPIGATEVFRKGKVPVKPTFVQIRKL